MLYSTIMTIDCPSRQYDLGDHRDAWHGTALATESKLHQLSPYIGKIKSTMAQKLVSVFTEPGDTLLDPFSGCGTVALEGWIAGRNVIANDLSCYAALLTRAKLFPPASLALALRELEAVERIVGRRPDTVDLRSVPRWVREFFHPDTLRELIAWFDVLRSRRSYFITACLLGILHHQRPGFLSYPSSHTVPYLRTANFPRGVFPELYRYRSVKDRLEKKMRRALNVLPAGLDRDLRRECHRADAASLSLNHPVSAIITSPPYMRKLDYGRDNRLRLWFLGESDWKQLDETISPSEPAFLLTMTRCFRAWKKLLVPRSYCVLVLGDTVSRKYRAPLPMVIANIATAEVGGFRQRELYSEEIPADRRVRRGYAGNEKETILVLQRCAQSGDRSHQ